MELEVTAPLVTRKGYALAVSVGARLNDHCVVASVGLHRSFKTLGATLTTRAAKHVFLLEKQR